MDSIMLEKFKNILNQSTELTDEEYQMRQEKLERVLLAEYEKCEGRYFGYCIGSYLKLPKLVENLVEYLTLHNPNGEITDILLRMQRENEKLYVHSVRVSYLCLVVTVGVLEKQKGKRMINLNGAYERDLFVQNGLSGLLHDIGKITADSRKPQKIWDEKEKMTPMEHQRYREHVIRGHYFLKNNGIHGDVLSGVLQHHENCAGKGFPMKLKAHDITDTGKIVAIANSWEHLTEDVNDFAQVDPFMLVRVMNESILILDQQYVSVLWEKLLQKFVGEKVRLTSGDVAELHKINAETPIKSMIRIGQKLENLERSDVEIEKLINVRLS